MNSLPLATFLITVGDLEQNMYMYISLADL